MCADTKAAILAYSTIRFSVAQINIEKQSVHVAQGRAAIFIADKRLKMKKNIKSHFYFFRILIIHGRIIQNLFRGEKEFPVRLLMVRNPDPRNDQK